MHYLRAFSFASARLFCKHVVIKQVLKSIKLITRSPARCYFAVAKCLSVHLSRPCIDCRKVA